MEDQNVAVRLKLFMEHLGLSNSQFADTCSIPRPSLSQLLSGRNKKLSDVVVRQIHEAFPQLSVLWLMFGEGQMLVDSPADPSLASDAAKFMGNGQVSASGANLNGSTDTDFTSNHSDNIRVSHDFPAMLSASQIEKKELPARKIISITIFYDDNSYEIFKPSKQ